jgi:hypothetical protein
MLHSMRPVPACCIYLRSLLFLSLPYLLSSFMSQMPLGDSLATRGGVRVTITLLICDQLVIKIEAQITGFLLFWGSAVPLKVE